MDDKNTYRGRLPGHEQVLVATDYDMTVERAPEILSPYYMHLREDVLRWVPATATHVLSVGCGAGRTEARLVERGCCVVGIEKDPAAADAARRAGVHVICADAEQANINDCATNFDCIIYADILEHLRRPEEVLRNHVIHLAPGGRVIVSVPNFRHLASLWALACGTWRYRDGGIFDRTHLRITTRQIVTDWLRCSGLVIECCCPVCHGRRWHWPARLTFGLFDQFLSQQLILVARKRSI